jgi:ATP-dependent helicase/nuclease subunit B
VALKEPIKNISASDINLYLKCPYRYYLEKVLKLSTSRDLAHELDRRTFGNLAHNVLDAFGKSDVRNSTSEEQVSDFLVSTLYQTAKTKYGASVLPAVRVQIEQLKVRLQNFAKSQAERATEGWQIWGSELATTDNPPVIEVDGHTIELHGRIDRVDYHPGSNKWAVLDYKTGDSVESPEKEHYSVKKKNRVWSNVQLPFYRMLAPHFKIGAQPQVGFARLPKSKDDTGFKIAKWEAEDFAEAEQVIHQVVRDILAEKFFPPAESPEYSDDYSRVCQDGVMERWTEPELQEGQL